MPLYECHCRRCDLTFETLAPLSASHKKTWPCPDCGHSSRRVISAVSFMSAGSRATEEPAPSVLNMKLPPAGRLCWMDERSSARFAAYKYGRGAEYDDTVAVREEMKQQRGEPANKPAKASHSHSPLSNPEVLAHRREAAARKAKAAESKKIVKERRSAD